MRKELLIDREILHNGKYKMSQVLQYCLVFARRYFQSGKGFNFFNNCIRFDIRACNIFFFVKKIIYKSPHTMGNNTICVWNI